MGSAAAKAGWKRDEWRCRSSLATRESGAALEDVAGGSLDDRVRDRLAAGVALVPPCESPRDLDQVVALREWRALVLGGQSQVFDVVPIAREPRVLERAGLHDEPDALAALLFFRGARVANDPHEPHGRIVERGKLWSAEGERLSVVDVDERDRASTCGRAEAACEGEGLMPAQRGRELGRDGTDGDTLMGLTKAQD